MLRLRMHDLQLVGFTTDRRGLIFRTQDATRADEGFIVPVTDELVSLVTQLDGEQTSDDGAADEAEGGADDAATRSEAPRAAAPRRRSLLSVRDIQARLRAGEARSHIAAEAGVDEDWIERFAPPIRAEQQRIVERALDRHLERSRSSPSAVPLRRAVGMSLADKGIAFTVAAYEAAWSARLLGHDRWVVEFRYHHRGRERTASWTYDAAEDVLTTADRAAAQLGYVAPGTAADGAGEAVDGIVGDRTATATRVPSTPEPEPPMASDPTSASTRTGPRPKRSKRARGRTSTTRSAAATKKAAAAKKPAAAKKAATRTKKPAAAKKAATAKKPAAAKKAATRTKKAGAAKKAATKTKKAATAKKPAAAKKAATRTKKAGPAKKPATKKAAAKKKPATKKAAAEKPAVARTPATKEKAAAKKPAAEKASVTEKASSESEPAAKEAAPTEKAADDGVVRAGTAPAPLARRFPDEPSRPATAPPAADEPPADEPPADARRIAGGPDQVRIAEVPLAGRGDAPATEGRPPRGPDPDGPTPPTSDGGDADPASARRARAVERNAHTVHFRSGSAAPVRAAGDGDRPGPNGSLPVHETSPPRPERGDPDGAARPSARRRRQLRGR